MVEAHAGGHSAGATAAGHEAQHESGCTCVGACQPAVSVALLPAPPATLSAPVLTTAAHRSVGRDERVHPQRIPYLLPYGQAPPAGC